MKYKLLLAFVTVLLVASNAEAAAKFKGFKEGAYSYRDGDNKVENPNATLEEVRIQLKTRFYPELIDKYSGEVNFKTDLYYDGVEGKPFIDLREFNFTLVPIESVDVKFGRQVLTWGTGDLLFINDFFPKDYVSFFSGRAQEYLKRPSDALKISHFGAFNTDIVFTPFFTPNNSLSGERFSVFNPFTGSIEGESLDREYLRPNRTIENSELALRFYKNIKSLEAAMYINRGFYKEPRGVLNQAKEEFYYPRVDTVGFSLRVPALTGIVNLELGYYSSRDDLDGKNPMIENSSHKIMAGFERDFKGDVKLGLQGYGDWMSYFDEYKLTVPKDFQRSEVRTLTTLSVSKMFLSQTVNAGVFIFYSPSDEDSYIRPVIAYDYSDNITFTVGANVFNGLSDNMYSDFGMVDGNDNYYGRLRYSF